MVTDFWRESAKVSIPHLHSVRWHSTTDGRIATWMRVNIAYDPSTSDKNWMNFHSVASALCRRVCSRAATRCGLPYASSLVY